jgi:radical SAM superfamily enzyme YgiQ (UPF0313 family)
MTQVLVTHSYFLRLDPKQWKAQQPYPPLGTLYVASVLREKGIEVVFQDVMFAGSPKVISQPLEKHQPKIVVICDDGFNYLTKMCLTNMRWAAFEMIGLAKERGCIVIVSGSDATDHSEKYFDAGSDFVAVGEAEQTILELTKALIGGEEKFSAIDGLIFREADVSIKTNKRQNLHELDKIPFPSWDLVDIESYRQRWLKSSGYFSINMVTTRGCPFKCNWCAKPIYGNRYNSRSPENVVEEIKMCQSLFGFDHIWFCDDIFGLKPCWISRFSVLSVAGGLNLKFKIQSRVDLLSEEDCIADLANAGCDEVWLGAESGSQKILDAMDKGTKVEQIYQTSALLKKAGIKPCLFLQFGYPGETIEDIKATLKMLFEIMPHDLGVSVSYPLPGTGFYESVKKDLKEKANWKDSDELLMMFENTFPSAFYKRLQRYVHHEFRKRQAFESLRNMKDMDSILKAFSLSYRIPQSLLSKARIRPYVV